MCNWFLFEPTFIALSNLYTHAFSSITDATVYTNGAMQVRIFISFNYRVDVTEEMLPHITDYIQSNAVIYELTGSGDVVPLDTTRWIKSTIDNGLQHDLEHGSTTYNATEYLPNRRSDIRVPLYFTVPRNAEGLHGWIAELDGARTSTSSPVTITAKRFAALPDNFEIVKRRESGDAELRVLRYKTGSYPDHQKLVRADIQDKGMKFTATGGNSWLTRVDDELEIAGAFLEYKESNVHVGIINYNYHPGAYETVHSWLQGHTYRLDGSWNDALQFTSSEVSTAWGEGIIMISLEHSGFRQDGASEKYTVKEPYDLEDNFGNVIEITIDWDVDEDDNDHTDWGVDTSIVM